MKVYSWSTVKASPIHEGCEGEKLDFPWLGGSFRGEARISNTQSTSTRRWVKAMSPESVVVVEAFRGRGFDGGHLYLKSGASKAPSRLNLAHSTGVEVAASAIRLR